MSWWNVLSSWMDGFWDNAASIEANTVAWAIQSAYSIVDAASDSFDILQHGWYDVINAIKYQIDALPGVYSILNFTYTGILQEIDNAMNRAVNIAQTASQNIVNGALAAYTAAHSIANYTWQNVIDEATKAENRAVNIAQTASQNIVNGALTAYTAAHSIVNYTWQNVIDEATKAKNVAINDAIIRIDALHATFNAALASATAIEGAARAALGNALYAAINAVEQGAKDALDAVNRSLTSAINSVQAGAQAAVEALDRALTAAIKTVESGAAAALLAVQTALTNAINTVEREAKEAREVLEGNLIYLMEELEAMTLRIIDAIDIRLEDAEDWINDSLSWFDTQFNTMQSRVVTWIVDSFISIIERVMEKEK